MKLTSKKRTIKRASNKEHKVKDKGHIIKRELRTYNKYVVKAKELNIHYLSKDEYDVLHKKNLKKIKRKFTPYERYVLRARELNVKTILKEGGYNETIRLNRKKGRKVNPEIIARWQFQGKKTDKQIDAMFNAAKLKNSKLTRTQFIRDRGWENIDKQAEDLYEEITSTEEYQRIEAQIEILEEKAKDEDLDLIDSRRLKKLKEDKYALLHQISQQVYGSE